MARLQKYKSFTKKLFKETSSLVVLLKHDTNEYSRLEKINLRFREALENLSIWNDIARVPAKISYLSGLFQSLLYIGDDEQTAYIRLLKTCAKIISLWDLPEFVYGGISRKLELGYINGVKNVGNVLFYSTTILTGENAGFVDDRAIYHRVDASRESILTNLGIPLRYLEVVRVNQPDDLLGLFFTQEPKSNRLVKTEYVSHKNFPIIQKKLGFDAKFRRIPVEKPKVMDDSEVMTWFYLGE